MRGRPDAGVDLGTLRNNIHHNHIDMRTFKLSTRIKLKRLLGIYCVASVVY